MTLTNSVMYREESRVQRDFLLFNRWNFFRNSNMNHYATQDFGKVGENNDNFQNVKF